MLPTMPSCERFIKDLAECLSSSECTKKYHKKPSECISGLQQYRIHQQSMNVGRVGDLYPEYTPVECSLKHQSYVECKLRMVNLF